MKNKQYLTGGDIASVVLNNGLSGVMAPINTITGGALDPLQDKLSVGVNDIVNSDNPEVDKINQTVRGLTKGLSKVGQSVAMGALFTDGGSVTDMFKKAYSHGGKLDYQTLEAIGVTKRQANKAYKDFLTKYESGGSLMPYNPEHLEKESENLVQYDGPDHPQGGIKTPAGEFNLEETVLKAGKVSDTPYAFSDINTLDVDTAKRLGLDEKHVGKTMAEISKSIEKKYEVKYNDDDTKAKTKQLMSQDLYSRLMEANETMLLKAKAKQMWDSKPNYGAMSQEEFNEYMCGGKVKEYQGGSWVDELNAEIDAMPNNEPPQFHKNRAFRGELDNYLRERHISDVDSALGMSSPLTQEQIDKQLQNLINDNYTNLYGKVVPHNNDILYPTSTQNAKSVQQAFKENMYNFPNAADWEEYRGFQDKKPVISYEVPAAKEVYIKPENRRPVATTQPSITPTVSTITRENINAAPIGSRLFNNQIPKVDPALTQLNFGNTQPTPTVRNFPQTSSKPSAIPIIETGKPSTIANLQMPVRMDIEEPEYVETGTNPEYLAAFTRERQSVWDEYNRRNNKIQTIGDQRTTINPPKIPDIGSQQIPVDVNKGVKSSFALPESIAGMSKQEQIGLGLKGLAQLGEVASTLGKKKDVAVQNNPYADQVSQLMRDRYVDMTPIQDQIASAARSAYENLAGTNSQVINAALGQGISNQSMAQMSQAKLQAQQLNNGYKGELASTLNNLGQQQVAAKNYQENLQAQTGANVNNVRREALGSIGNDLGNYFIAKDVVKAKTAEERAALEMKLTVELLKIPTEAMRKEAIQTWNKYITSMGGEPFKY